jgi:hypothetical protein
MRSHAKGDMTIGATRQVEPIRIGKLRRVAVRRAQQQDKELVWPDPPACQFDLFRNAADQNLNGGLVTQ